jgi:hypothetical protein
MRISTQLSYRPRLTVSAWTYFVDNEGGGRMLAVQVVNPRRVPVRVTSVSCSLSFADLPLGNRNVEVPLTELDRASPKLVSSGPDPKTLTASRTRGQTASKALGHSRIGQTMNTCAHAMPHNQADAFGRFSKRFSQR